MNSIDPSSETFTWLGCPLKARIVDDVLGLIEVNGVRGFLIGGDIGVLFGKAVALSPGSVIVEVGSYLGLSALLMASALYSRGDVSSRIHCVDTWDGPSEYVGSRFAESRPIFDVFRENIAHSGFGSRIVPLKAPSVEAATRFAPQSIDLVFIDADHSLEGCLSDLEAWYPRLKPGGVLIGHDYRPGNPVSQAVERFTSKHGLRSALVSPDTSTIFEILS